jgi:hypothetical protein
LTLLDTIANIVPLCKDTVKILQKQHENRTSTTTNATNKRRAIANINLMGTYCTHRPIAVKNQRQAKKNSTLQPTVFILAVYGNVLYLPSVSDTFFKSFSMHNLMSS